MTSVPVSASAQPITITCVKSKEVVGTLFFGAQNKLIPGCAKRCRRHMVKKMGMTRNQANVVILHVMNRYTKSDDVIGYFAFADRNWAFADPDFEMFCAEEKKRIA